MIRTTGELRPPILWAPAPDPKVAQIDETLGYYLFGLWHYVYFSFGAPSRIALRRPSTRVEVDTEYLVLERGARAVRQECLDPEQDIGPRILEALGVHERVDPIGGRGACDVAADAWQRNPIQWTTQAWQMAHDELIPELTLGGTEALDFLRTLDVSELGATDILLNGSLMLTEPTVRVDDLISV